LDVENGVGLDYIDKLMGIVYLLFLYTPLKKIVTIVKHIPHSRPPFHTEVALYF
jgi:hypothetical protein